MTLPEFTTQLAAALNKQFDIPWQTEAEEQELLEAGVSLVAMRIPESLRGFMVDAADGIDAAEIAIHKPILIDELAKLIDNRRVPNWIERWGAELMIDAVLNFALKGQSV